MRERTPEEKTLLIKKALLGLLVALMIIYVLLWYFGMVYSIWTGIVSGLFLVVLLVLALVQRSRG